MKTKQVRPYNYGRDFKSTYKATTKGGVDFMVKHRMTMWLVLEKGKEPELLDANCLALAQRLRPKAHSFFEVTGVTLLEPAKKQLSEDDLRRLEIIKDENTN